MRQNIYFLENVDLLSPMRVLLLCGTTIAEEVGFVNSLLC